MRVIEQILIRIFKLLNQHAGAYILPENYFCTSGSLILDLRRVASSFQLPSWYIKLLK